MSPDNLLWYLLVATLTSLIATLPFGPINLTVIKTTVDHHRAGAIKVSLGASLVETGQALLAIWFGAVISQFISAHASLHFIAAVLFVGLAVFVWVHETHPVLKSSDDAEPDYFKRGVVIAFINAQAIPFWIFAATITSSYLGFEYTGLSLYAYLAGVGVGKMLALYGFVTASEYLKSHLEEGSRFVNHLLAVVLGAVGLLQLWSGINHW